MFNIILVEPEIPQNTGNIIRLSALTGCALHLVEPLGFDMSDAKLRRAGLDYHEFAHLHRHASWEGFLREAEPDPTRMFAFAGQGPTRYDRVTYEADDWLVFGGESKGLPLAVREWFPADQVVRLPMLPSMRSLNLATAVHIGVYEAWRQHDFPGSS